MNDELLPYYNRELAHVRRHFREFAEKHPETAAVLRIGADACDDPHVERMIMAFAYLTARVRQKLDDDFPELTDALLGVLYPHYLAPVPSMTIAEFRLDRGQGALTEGYRLEKGAEVETEYVGDDQCRYRMGYPVTLWPVEVASARITRRPFDSPAAPEGAAAVLRLELRCFSREMTFAKLALSSLRFYLHGQTQHAFALYESLLNDTVRVTVSRAGEKDPGARILPVDCLRPVGFAPDEGLLPYPPQSFLGYRLLTEYFAFAEKFRFVDLTGLDDAVRSELGSRITVDVYLRRSSDDLERNVTADSFRLGCSPLVNLFPKSAEPIVISHDRSEYPVVPDVNRRLSTEIYSIDRVSATSVGGAEVEYEPFYSFRHAASRSDPSAFWHAARRPASRREDEVDHGTEMTISLVDLDLSTEMPANWTLHVDTTCLNRDLPQHLPFGGGRPALQLVDGGPVVSEIVCLTAPTPTQRPPQSHGARWRVLSHLLLNHLSLTAGEEGAHALREILKLYDHVDSPQTASKIDGIRSIRSRRVVGRAGGVASGGLCRGIEVSVEFDEERFPDNSLFLFASLLERFLGTYCSINSFSQLVATKQQQKVFRKWPPRAGDRVLI